MDDPTKIVAGALLSGIHNVEAKIGTPNALTREGKDGKGVGDTVPRIMWFGVDLDCAKFAKTSGAAKKDLLATTHGIKSYATTLEKQIGISLLMFPERDI